MRRVLAAGPNAVLAVLMLRRLAFLGAALAPPRGTPIGAELPTVAIAVPVCNEEAVLDRLLDSLDALAYPEQLLTVVLVDDASEDRSAQKLHAFASGRARTQVLESPQRAGKASALNAALAVTETCDVFVALDADTLPRPAAVLSLAEVFADANVGSAAALVRPANADESVVARYAATEILVHQLITSAAKDRLDLNPPGFAMTAYRRAALDQIGGFSSRGEGDDVTANAELTRADWRTRFVRDAVAETWVVDRAAEYWRQHVRWGRNVFVSASGGRAEGGPAPPGRRIELAVNALGYADRIALAAAVAFGGRPGRGRRLAAAYLGLRAVEAAAALERAGRAREAPRHLAALLALFPLDVAASLAAAVTLPFERRATWTSPTRRPSGRDKERTPSEPGAVPA